MSDKDVTTKKLLPSRRDSTQRINTKVIIQRPIVKKLNHFSNSEMEELHMIAPEIGIDIENEFEEYENFLIHVINLYFHNLLFFRIILSFGIFILLGCKD